MTIIRTLLVVGAWVVSLPRAVSSGSCNPDTTGTADGGGGCCFDNGCNNYNCPQGYTATEQPHDWCGFGWSADFQVFCCTGEVYEACAYVGGNKYHKMGCGERAKPKSSTVEKCKDDCDRDLRVGFRDLRAQQCEAGCEAWDDFVCSAGYYLAENTCANSCPTGTYRAISGGIGVQACQQCGPGKYSLTRGAQTADTCSPCAPGKWSDELGAGNSATCRDCGPGTHNPSFGASQAASCEPCPSGRYQNDQGGSECKSCPAGRHLSSKGAVSADDCVQCGAGKYNSKEGSKSELACEPCPLGTYSPALGSASEGNCAGCPSGKKGTSTALTSSQECEACPSGTSSSERSSVCGTCPEGEFGDAGFCQTCRAGHYCQSGGQVACPAGRYNAKTGQSSMESCLPCDVGTYFPNAGATSNDYCVPCPGGKYGNVLGAESVSDGCPECAIGKFRTAGGDSTACEPCETGTTTESSGQTYCTPCESGKALVNLSCIECAEGKWSITGAVDECTPCVAGYYGKSGNEVRNRCVACPPGRHGDGATDATSVEACADCTAGFYSAATGVPAADRCVACPPGRIGEAAGATGITGCAHCEAGKHIASMGATACEPCGKGEFSGPGQATCSLCGLGNVSDPASATCSPCPGATYIDELFKAPSDCKSCDGGKVKRADGLGCEDCDQGKYSNDGNTVCVACPDGTYTDATGLASADQCTKCLPGTEARHVEGGATSEVEACSPCKPGEYSDDGTTCKACDGPGKYSLEARAAYCVVATAGHRPNTARTAQELCPENTFSLGASDACKPCPNGFSQEGSASCTTCEPGSRTDRELERCVGCEAGFFSKDGAECEKCQGEGEYASTTNATYCSVATAGHRPNAARTAQEPCPENTFSLGASDTCEPCSNGFSPERSATCTTCEPGSRTDSELERCVGCEAGFFSKDGAECEKCQGEGEYASTTNATYCSVATAGHRPNAARTAQEPCPRNTFSLGASDTCADCGPNEYSESGSFSCSPCPAGQTLNEARSGCEPCPIGSIRQFHEAACHLCLQGTYANQDQTDCLPCDAGAYGDVLGLTNSTCSGLCPAGTYSSLYATFCTRCETGKYNPTVGQEACLACDPSHPTYLTSDMPGATECVCLPGKYNSTEGRCLPCSKGMDCSEAGGDVASLKLEKGSWRPNSLSDEVLTCPVPEACLQSNLTSDSHGCRPGNEGVLCAICSQGFYRPSSFATCAPCGDQTLAVLSAFGVLLGMVACGAIFIHINRRAPSGLLRPFINLIQQLTVMLMFDAPFPQALVDLYKVLAGMSLGVDVASPQCAGVGSNFYGLFLLSLLSLGVAMLVLMAGPLHTIFRNKSRLDLRSNVEQVVVSAAGARAFRDVFVVVLVLHPPISGKAMEFFRCHTIDGVPYLMADYSLVCYDGAWFAYLFIVVLVLVLVLFSLGTPIVIVYVLYLRRLTLYGEDGTPTPQPLDILYAIYRKEAFWYESVQMVFKLALWSTLVFFEHGSEMQLAAALVVNVLQLCVHIEIKPMGGEDATLLNLMQTCTLVLTTYINFGALCMNYLEVSKELAQYTDPDSIGLYDGSIEAIGIVMEVLTFGLFLSFGGVVIKKAVFGVSAARDRLRSLSRGDAAAPHREAPRGGAGLAVELASFRSKRLPAKTPAPSDDAVRDRQISVDVEAEALPAPSPPNAGPTPSPQTDAENSKLPEGWSSRLSPQGSRYYFCAATGESSWVPPAQRTRRVAESPAD